MSYTDLRAVCACTGRISDISDDCGRCRNCLALVSLNRLVQGLTLIAEGSQRTLLQSMKPDGAFTERYEVYENIARSALQDVGL